MTKMTENLKKRRLFGLEISNLKMKKNYLNCGGPSSFYFTNRLFYLK